MRGKIAKWWLPDDVVFVDEIPHTATGKIQKTELREHFRDYVLPTAARRARCRNHERVAALRAVRPRTIGPRMQPSAGS